MFVHGVDDPQVWLDHNAPIFALFEARLIREGDHFAGLTHMLFTTSIVVGEIGDTAQYQDRWCYEDYGAALEALDQWTVAGGTGEPSGWHRHPSSGRRVARSNTEIDQHGNRVEPGQMYVRR